MMGRAPHGPHFGQQFEHAGSVVVENLLMTHRTFRGVVRAASQALIREQKPNHNKTGVDGHYLIKAG